MKKPTDQAVAEALQQTDGIEGVLAALRILLHDWRAPVGNLLGAVEILATDFTAPDKPIGSMGATLLRIIDEESRNNLTMLQTLKTVASHLQRLADVETTLRNQIKFLVFDWMPPAQTIQSAAQILSETMSDEEQSFQQASIDLLRLIDKAGRMNQQLIDDLEKTYIALKKASASIANDTSQ